MIPTATTSLPAPVPDDAAVAAADLRPGVRALLYAHRALREGTPVTVRLNLNGRVDLVGRAIHLQTVHAGRSPKAVVLGYDTAVTLRDVTFSVYQASRSRIALGVENRNPMAGVMGGLVHVPPSLEGLALRFDPRREHLFVTADGGLAVRSADEVTVHDRRVHARGRITYWSRAEAPEPLGGVHSAVRYALD